MDRVGISFFVGDADATGHSRRRNMLTQALVFDETEDIRRDGGHSPCVTIGSFVGGPARTQEAQGQAAFLCGAIGNGQPDRATTFRRQ